MTTIDWRIISFILTFPRGFNLPSELKAQYIKDKGLFCPFCKRKNLQVDSTQLNGEQCEVEVSCEDCEEEWKEIYTLTDVELTEGEC